MSVTLSLAMIVKDEEAVIGRVLEDAAAVCDQLVVVDTGSTDNTVSLALQAGANVHHLDWVDDFSAARNYALEHCTCGWIMWLDADDTLPARTKETILDLKVKLNDDLNMVVGPYHYDIQANGTVYGTVVRERMIRRGSGLQWQGSVHEVIPIDERYLYVEDLVIKHRPDRTRVRDADRNLRILAKEMTSESPTPRTVFYYANELYDHASFNDAIVAYHRFLAEPDQPGDDRYWAMVRVMEAANALGDHRTLLETAATAIIQDSSRAEAYVCLGRLFYDRHDWARAVPVFSAATAAVMPTSGIVRNADYGYVAWDYLAVCLDNLGRHVEALAAAQRALVGNPDQERIRNNMKWMVDRL